MAELYLARANGIEGFEKLVVLKRILPQLANDRGFVKMFLDEARIAATLQNSNIVQVYDIGEAEGGYFFAMEYLRGSDLHGIMRAAFASGRGLPLEHTLSIILGVCSGLHYAHDKLDGDGRPLGIVHRDVSPHNVFVTYDGGVKILDFGIAKAAHRLSETRQGTLKGKLQYMSPEQCQCEPLDRRSDVFAIAILLWELSVGQRLYDGKSELAIMKSIVEHDATRPSELSPNYPPELERIVRKGLARRPADRFQSAEELQLALEAFAREHRLALSPVGLQRYLRELVGEPRSAIEDIAAQPSPLDDEDDEPGAADQVMGFSTDVDGVSLAGADASVPRGTRALRKSAVARPARNTRRNWVAAFGLAGAAAVAFTIGFARFTSHSGEEPIVIPPSSVTPEPEPIAKTAPAPASPELAAPPVPEVAPSAPAANAAAPSVSPGAPESVPEVHVAPAPIVLQAPPRSHVHKSSASKARSRAKRRSGGAPDLDAPLPP